MFILKKKYFFIIESIKEIDLKDIKNFGKYNIIYRNKNPENIEEIKIFRFTCKIKKIPFYVSNNVDLMVALKADGLYVSAHNQKLNLINYKKKYDIIGSAHNIKEINIKKNQGCSLIFLSRLFKTHYKNKKSYLGVVRFNLLTRLINISLSPLGGINLNNLSKLKNVNCENLGLSSVIINRPAEIQKLLK